MNRVISVISRERELLQDTLCLLPVSNGLKNPTKFSVQRFKLKGALENTTSKSQNLVDAFLMMENQTSFSFVKKNT